MERNRCIRDSFCPLACGRCQLCSGHPHMKAFRLLYNASAPDGTKLLSERQPRSNGTLSRVALGNWLRRKANLKAELIGATVAKLETHGRRNSASKSFTAHAKQSYQAVNHVTVARRQVLNHVTISYDNTSYTSHAARVDPSFELR